MYSDHTILQTIGQLLIAFLFVATGLINAATKFRQHLDRMVAVGVPFAKVALVTGFAMQLVGGLLVALVKPQFEVGPAHVDKGGVVRDPVARRAAMFGTVSIVWGASTLVGRIITAEEVADVIVFLCSPEAPSGLDERNDTPPDHICKGKVSFGEPWPYRLAARKHHTDRSVNPLQWDRESDFQSHLLCGLTERWGEPIGVRLHFSTGKQGRHACPEAVGCW